MSSDMIERRIISLGGKVVAAVSKSTTHLMLGDSGMTQYGQKTGVGSKKYKEAKKKKCIQLTYQDLVDAETSSQGQSGSSSSGGGGGPASKLKSVWDELLKALQAGNDRALWKMPDLKPPATLDEIGDIEKDFGFRLGKYNDLLLLANGVSWHEDISLNGAKESISLVFGGTGDDEDDLRHAFNYSGDYGRRHFRSKKQVPYQMIDYDFCVNVLETGSGKLMQDDRECGSYHLLHHSIQDWLEEITSKLNAAIAEDVAKAK
jgi:hypothetical protein